MLSMGKEQIAAVLVAVLCLFGSFGEGARAQESLPELIKRVLPAVVTVVGFNAQGKVIRIGSGVFVDPQGHLITNLHVIKGVARTEVKLPKGEVYPLSEMVAVDDKADLVKLVVNLPGGSPHYLTVSGARPEVGEHVVVLGSPLGLEHTVTDGMVSAIRTIKNRGEFLQISAPISPGSSGGPVVNMKGQVIGIATFQVRGQNINFAVPGYRVLALKNGPPKALPGQGTAGSTLPARPGVNIPRPQMQVNQDYTYDSRFFLMGISSSYRKIGNLWEPIAGHAEKEVRPPMVNPVPVGPPRPGPDRVHPGLRGITTIQF